MRGWTRTTDTLPAEGSEVEAITPSGAPTRLAYSSGMWWTPDRSMYVYFVPTWWRT